MPLPPLPFTFEIFCLIILRIITGQRDTKSLFPAFCRPSLTYNNTRMAPSPSTTRAEAESWAVDSVVSRFEVWALVAAFIGVVGAWRLLGLCWAARAGVKEFLGPSLGWWCAVAPLSGGGWRSGGGAVSEVWALDLATMRWGAIPALLSARRSHACCAVMGVLVVLGG